MPKSIRPKTLLAIDIGNTSAFFGFFRLNPPTISLEPFSSFRFPTIRLKNKSYLRKFWARLRAQTRVPGAVIISSVVPQINRSLKFFLQRSFKIPVQFVSARNPGALKIRYKIPSELGADRIANGRGAMAYCSGSAIVVDFGTATTFDCVSPRREFLGGVIAPGPIISAEALYERTAKLPFVHLSRPSAVIGKNTSSSIQSGLFHGYRGMILEIVRRLKEKLGRQTKLLATGGQAPLILKNFPLKFKYLPYLTLTGLLLLWLDEFGNKVSHRG